MEIFKDSDGRSVDYYPSSDFAILRCNKGAFRVEFQNGPFKHGGYNGVTNEMLISLVTERLTVLDNELPCDENRMAIFHLNAAKEQLDARMERRKKEILAEMRSD